MFINNTKENWELYANAIRNTDAHNRATNTKPLVPRVEDCTKDFVRDVERVAKASKEGNYTPAIIAQIMAHDITKLIVETTLSIISKRKITNTDIADIGAVIASDYTIAAANLAYQKYEQKLIENQIAEVTA